MKNRREILERKRLEIIDKYGGKNKVALSVALHNLLREQKLKIIDYVTNG